MGHLYIAAAHKSSGKTSVSIGLTAALSRNGLVVQAFKKGPDYIDPLWLARASGRPCFNLDFFTQSHDEIRATFAGKRTGADISLIEGNKGLYDGLDTAGTDSNAALAKLLESPVVLVIDTTGTTRGIAPLVRGYLDFDEDVNIAGVILNKVGGSRHEGKLRAALERYTDLEVLGAIGRDKALEIPERHLGLVPANEAGGAGAADMTIARLADAVSAGVELERIAAAAASSGGEPAVEGAESTYPAPGVRIAVARDAAFGFYYADDLDAFARAGAELVPFDALRDPRLPEADGLFIGGGFPETQLDALAANKVLLADVHRRLAAGMPAYAECGGLMYLARSISWRGVERDMVGIVPADVVVEERPQGRGYMRLEETADHPWPAAPSTEPGIIPVHEFHHARLINMEPGAVYAHKVLRGAGIDGQHDALVVNRLMAGFAHHRNTGRNPWVGRFVDYVRNTA
jgi:cobyrinic acid a,c-diamide synthase